MFNVVHLQKRAVVSWMQSRMVALECHVSCMERTNPKNLNLFGFTELCGSTER